MKLFISQPMKDRSNEEIQYEREQIIDEVNDLYPNVEVINSFIEDTSRCENNPLWCLGKSFELLSSADIVWFADGWEHYRGCKLEHEAAIQYGIKIVKD